MGGLDGRANNYSKYLVILGHTVEVISFSQRGDFSREDLHGATLLNFPSSSRSAITTFRRTVKEISRNSFDSVFLLSGALTLYGLMILLYGLWKGVKISVLYYGKDILSARKKLSAHIALKISPKWAKKIIVNSRYTASLLPSKYASKIVTLYPSVDPSIADSIVLHPGESLHRLAKSIDDGEESSQKDATSDSGGRRETVLFVGRLVKRKGVDDLLNAFKSVLKNFPLSKLEIVGDGPEYLPLQNLAEDLGLSGSVKFYGNLTGSKLYERYKSCDLFVMPSKTTEVDVEGFGTVFLEAGLFGKPSIGTRSGGIPEAIQDGKTGILVPEGDVKLLADSIERILLNRDLATKFGETARATVLADFTWDISTRRLVSILEPENK